MLYSDNNSDGPALIAKWIVHQAMVQRPAQDCECAPEVAQHMADATSQNRRSQ
jgi:hypothetical protein